MLQTLQMCVMVLIIAVDYSDGCSCYPLHKQELYCMSDFVLQVRVKDEEIIYSKREDFTAENETRIDRYPVSRQLTVKIKKAFRIKENYAGLSKNSQGAILHTPYDSAACGVGLKPKEKYIVAGNIYDKELSLYLCGWVAAWSTVTKMQKKHLRYNYENNCDCTVLTVFNEHWKKSRAETCDWDVYTDDGDCYDKESVCVHNKNSVLGECKWQRNNRLKACRKEVKRRRWEP